MGRRSSLALSRGGGGGAQVLVQERSGRLAPAHGSGFKSLGGEHRSHGGIHPLSGVQIQKLTHDGRILALDGVEVHTLEQMSALLALSQCAGGDAQVRALGR